MPARAWKRGTIVPPLPSPNGTVGVVWRRYVYESARSQFNYNVYFATFGSAGVRLAAPVQISNYGYSSAVIFSPTMAASSDNQFVIGWELNNSWQHDIFFAVRNTNGAQTVASRPLTSNHHGAGPILNTLTGGKVIMTWSENGTDPAVLTSTGSISKPKTMLNASDFDARLDAVQLPNGK